MTRQSAEADRLTSKERESLTAVVKTWLPMSYAGLIPRLEAWITKRDSLRGEN